MSFVADKFTKRAVMKDTLIICVNLPSMSPNRCMLLWAGSPGVLSQYTWCLLHVSERKFYRLSEAKFLMNFS